MTEETRPIHRRRAGAGVRRLRVLAGVLVLTGMLAFWQSTQPGTSLVGDGFLGVVRLQERDWIVRGVAEQDGRPRFTVSPAGEASRRLFSGRPRAVVATRPGENAPGQLIVFFDASASRNAVVEDDERAWEVIDYPDGFRPLAAALDATGAVIAAGRAEDDSILIGKIEPAARRLALVGDPIPALAEDAVLGFAGDATALVIARYGSEATRVEAIALTEDRPRLDLERWTASPRAAVAADDRIAWLDAADDLRLREPDGAQRVLATLADRPDVGPIRLALGRDRVYVRSAGDVLGVAFEGPSEPTTVTRASTLVWEYLGYLFAWLGTMSALVAARDAATASKHVAGSIRAAVPARLLRRAAAWGLDAFGLTLVVFLKAAFVGREPQDFADDEVALTAFIIDWELLGLLYFVLTEAIFGRSLGKRALGLQVIGADGQPAGVVRIVLRNAMRFLDARGGAILAILSRRRQRVGDWVARTLVVETHELPPPKESSVPFDPGGSRHADD